MKAFLDSFQQSIHSLVLLKPGDETTRLGRILFDLKMSLGNNNKDDVLTAFIANNSSAKSSLPERSLRHHEQDRKK